jgi:hypothetical protein
LTRSPSDLIWLLADSTTLWTFHLTYLQATAARRLTRDLHSTALPHRQRLAVVPQSGALVFKGRTADTPKLPGAEATFSPLVQEFLDECGYSDK